jgi:hypothetical protein
MATTTNYSWSTPDDTALVKDGAAAIRSLGTAIDTTVFNNAGAAIAKTIVDAKGDIIAATAADTVSRLAVGANDTVLTADSTTATGLKWAAPAGGSSNFVLLNAGGTTLTGAQTITVSGISAKSQIYVFVEDARSVNAGATMWFTMNTDTNANYMMIRGNQQQGTAQVVAQSNIASPNSSIEMSRSDNENISQAGWLYINNANSINYKPYQFAGFPYSATGSARLSGSGFYLGTSAISSVSINCNQGNFSQGKIYVYTTA